MNLEGIIDQLKSIEGYVHHRLRYSDIDSTKYYIVWVSRDGRLKAHDVRLLVLKEGEVDEEAQIYTIPNEIDPRGLGPFRTELEAFIVSYQVSNPELEYYEINSTNEELEKGRVTAYFFNGGVLSTKSFLAFKLNGELKFRELA